MSLSVKKPGMWTRLYNWMLAASRHPHAPRYLGAVSFAESSFFPLPPDIMLAPMVLARPQHWWQLALFTTVASILGGMFGWVIGYFAIESVLPLIKTAGYLPAYETTQRWFQEYGFMALIVAGFTPVPFKMFTISAGAAAMSFGPFVAAAVLGRGARFILVAGLIRALGPTIEPHLARFMDWLGWVFLALLLLGFALIKFL